jgi:hypothetical protein
MASSITGDTLSTLDSSRFDGLSQAERDCLDEELDDLDTTSASSRKRPREQTAVEWSYAQPPQEGQEKKDKHSHRIWYCGQLIRGNKPCPYSTTTIRHARTHLAKDHLVILRQVSTKRQATLSQGFKVQKGRPLPQFSAGEKELLRRVIDKDTINEKLVRLLACNNQSLRSVEWKELAEFCHALNPFAAGALPSRKKIKNTLISIHRKLEHPSYKWSFLTYVDISEESCAVSAIPSPNYTLLSISGPLLHVQTSRQFAATSSTRKLGKLQRLASH